MYVDLVLPLALPKPTYTYSVPEGLRAQVQVGLRVEAPLGKSKLYSGIILKIHDEKPAYPTKDILSVLDTVTIVTELQLGLWVWLSEYYCCSLGEVMMAALPAHLRLNSETKLVFNPGYGDDFSELDSEAYLLAEALLLQQEFTLETVRKILNKKTVFPVVQQLLTKGVLFLREDLREKYKPMKQTAVRLGAALEENPDALKLVFEQLDRSERQLEMLMAYLHLSKTTPQVYKSALLEKAGVGESTLKTMIKKGIFALHQVEISRIAGYDAEMLEAGALSAAQQTAVTSIQTAFETKNTVLLQGVTGSGKTRVYLELIRTVVARGGQVLYLLPEIALTTQLTQRLQRILGDQIAVYHSKIGFQERVELWRSAFEGKPVLMGPRSALFLPFKNLELIIVDEEHDGSFKQQEPAPRYHARDTAVYLAHVYGAKVLLGTATPSLESYHNAQLGKYGYVRLDARFGGLSLPEMRLVDLKDQQKKRQMEGVFSHILLETMRETLARKEQIILFQNRRGYAPMLSCTICGWNAICKDCDVSLTFHKFSNQLRCHYCGYRMEPPVVCPACGSGKLQMLGFGTEKIEDELKLHFPDARLARMDLDTAGTRSSLSKLLRALEGRELDILVGTQMVTKGFDFEHVGMVGVVGADQLVGFPDFRAGERAFQVLTQVAGRSGRKHKQGLVLIQAYNPAHPVLQEVLRGDFEGFAARELAERQAFFYPPFSRLIALQVRHKDAQTAAAAAAYLGKILRERFGKGLLGPVMPQITRVRTYYRQDLMLKLEKSGPVLQGAKRFLTEQIQLLLSQPGFALVHVVLDVDPV